MDGRLLAEERLEVGIGHGAGLERAEPLLQPERAEERLLHCHLLVEREADEERERILGEQRVGFVVARVVQPVGLRRSRHADDPTPAASSEPNRSRRATASVPAAVG